MERYGIKMKHVKINAFDIPDAWYKTNSAIWTEGEIFFVGYGSEETETKKLDVTIEIEHPENLPYVSDKAPTNMAHVQEYGLTYLWTNFKGEHPYTYGSRLREPIDQVEEVIKAIISDGRNRQLTMVIRIPEDVYKKNPKTGEKHDPPCLTMIDIECLNGKMNMTCYFRSWDAYAGLPENIAGLFLFLQAMVSEVNERLPEGQEPYQTGKMILHSKNCHIYKRVYPLVTELFAIKNHRFMDKMKGTENNKV
jgi:thymidylate synthase